MKSNTAVQNLLLNADAIKAVPEVVIDWNMNRYIGAVASNTPGAGIPEYDVEYFPVESIVEPLRPTKGINKARVGSATVGDDYKVGGAATPNGRFYIADPDDTYKYYTSPTPSDGAGVLANTKPQVVYASSVAVNKIVITLENTWASPKTFQIQTTTSANPTDANWTTVATDATTPAGWKGKGQIVLYWDGTDWQNANRSANGVTTNIRGVRIVVTALEGGYKVTADGSAVPSTYGTLSGSTYTTTNTTGFNSYFDLIEISARLEVDLSDSMISVDDAADMSEVDQLYPIGTITSNQGTLVLSNLYLSNGDWVPGLFSKSNAASPYKDYIDANAEVNLRYKFYDEDDVFVGAIQQFKMYTETWSGQTTDTVTVNLSDYSKFLNVQNVRPALWENQTVPQIIWRILDSVGCTNYAIDAGDFVTEHTIPAFYVDGESTVWEVLDELAQASQTAIYFDSFGVLQVKTRDYAFSPTDAPVWRFSAGVPNDTKLSDIVALDQLEEFAPNHYTITYQKTNWSEANRAGQPTLQKVWEPEDTVVLRAAPLFKTIPDAAAMTFALDPKEAKTWPYDGIINIDGEVMRYKGKEFVYYTGAAGDVENKVFIESFDDSERRNAETPIEYRHKNHFTGVFQITERGMWDSSVAAAHTVDIMNYSVRGRANGNNKANVSGIRHLKKESKLLLNPPKAFKTYKDIMVATIGDTDDTSFYHYGTKMRFVKAKGQKTQCGGILLNNSGAGEGDGYYIEFTPSKNLSGKDRKSRHELIFYSRTGNKDKRIGGKGQALPIGENVDFEVDVHFAINGNDHKISIWVNGKKALNVTVSGSNRQAANGKFGLFTRGKTKTEHEYLYAVKEIPEEPMEDFSFMDKLQGGYSGQQWERNWVHGWKDNSRKVRRKTKDKRHRLNDYFIDEFGPIVHEIREYDVKFDPAPVLHSRIYNTNDWSSAILEYNANPFGAKFIIANTSRKNAVLNGDDSLSFAGTGDSVSQLLTVFGRALVVEEAEEVVAKNDAQIRRRGKIESELSNPWIQSKTMANDVKDWLVDTFSYGNEQITLEVFGNPMVEIADVVTVQYPDKHINGDYFIIGIRNAYDSGLTTSITLRKRVRTS